MTSLPLPPVARLLALGGELAPPPPGVARRKFDLAHMRTLLGALGDPQLRFRSVLIAGTNGKGSTAATLASILSAAGHRVGLYTSPHLEQPHERIRIRGEAIANADLAADFEWVESVAAGLVANGELPHTPSFFETITAIGFLHFAGYRAPGTDSGSSRPALSAPAVDLAVLEVGLGGRLDATNVVEPLVSILTDISLDHTEWLGSTIAEITREKAGILRAGGTLITLPQHPEANQVIGEVAMPLGVHAINAADYLPALDRNAGAEGAARALRNRYSLALPAGLLGGAVLTLDSPLAGAHQQRNLALALAAAVTLHKQNGFALDQQAIEEGVRTTDWPARLQLFSSPETGAPRAPVLLDAAHNPAGAWALRAALSSLPISGSRTLVFGCMADKAAEELAQILFPVFDLVLLTRSRNQRAASLERLAAAAERTGAAYRTFDLSEQALAAARESTPENGLIVLAGSIALLGELQPVLRAQH